MPIFCCKVCPPKPSSCPTSCSVSCISPCQQHCCQERYLPNFSTQSPPMCPSQCAIHCEDMCPVHCHPASSEQSSFLTIFNTNRKRPAKFFAHRTVHTVGPSIVAWGDKKSPYLFKTPEQTSPVGRSLAVQEADYKS